MISKLHKHTAACLIFIIFIISTSFNSLAAKPAYNNYEKLFISKGTIKILLSNSKIVIGKTSKIKITLTINPKISKAKITYSLGNTKIASIDKNNIIKGISVGKTYIKVTYLGKSASANIEIQPLKISSNKPSTKTNSKTSTNSNSSISNTRIANTTTSKAATSEPDKNTQTQSQAVEPKISSETNENIISTPEEFTAAIKTALSSNKELLKLNIKNYDSKLYNVSDIIDNILAADPSKSLGYSGGSITTYSNNSNITAIEVQFKYDSSLYSKNKKIYDMNIAADKKAKEIVASLIKPDMNDVQKELVLHDYLVNNARYDSENFYAGTIPDESYNAYGVLINGVGVCQSYAEAMYKLLTLSGIESMVVTGTATNGVSAVSHAWNIVKLDGQYYQLDITWDDPVTNDGANVLSHTYFNLTDTQINKNHNWDTSKYPQCTSTKYSFSTLGIPETDSEGDAVLVVNDYNSFYKFISNAIINSKKSVSLKVTNYNRNVYNLKQIVQKIVDDAGIENISSYKTSMSTDSLDNNIEYIKLYFNYR